MSATERGTLGGIGLVVGVEHLGQAATEPLAADQPGELVGQPLVVQRPEALLALGERGQVEVDRPVRDDPAGHVEVERHRRSGARGRDGARWFRPCRVVDHRSGWKASGEQLTADRVAHVMGDQRTTVDAEFGEHRNAGVGVQVDAVAAIGLVGEAEAEEVEEHHPAAASTQIVEHEPPVERARGETVQDDDRFESLLGADLGREIDHEDVSARSRQEPAHRAPSVDRCRGGVRRCAHAVASSKSSPHERTAPPATDRTRPFSEMIISANSAKLVELHVGETVDEPRRTSATCNGAAASITARLHGDRAGDAPAIFSAAASGDEATTLHAPKLMRQSARLPVEEVGELVRAQLAVDRL